MVKEAGDPSPPKETMEGLMESGLDAARKGNSSEAITCLRKAVELGPENPKNAKTYSELGRAYMRMASASKDGSIIVLAKDAYNKAIGLGFDGPDAHAGLGNAHMRLREYDSAIAEFQKAVEYKTDDKRLIEMCYIGLSQAHNLCGRPEEEAKYARKLIELKPDDRLKKRMREAESEAERTKKPKTADDYFLLGTLRYKRGAFDESAKAYKKAIKLQPDQARTYSALAITYDAQGNLDLAVENFSKAFKIEPNMTCCHNLGIAVRKRDGEKAAAAVYEGAYADLTAKGYAFTVGEEYILFSNMTCACGRRYTPEDRVERLTAKGSLLCDVFDVRCLNCGKKGKLEFKIRLPI
jgi:tetratricopeptide (TPR) repeat protein